MLKAVIIHGTQGSPDGNWFPWLSAELGQRGVQCYVPQFPTPEGQSLENWLKVFAAQAGPLDKESLLIGHSVGAVFALRLLERLEHAIGAAVLVAGFTGKLNLPEYDALNSSFVESRFDWSRIRQRARKFICLSGENDPYVPAEQGREIANNLMVRHVLIAGGGHLNAESGFIAFPRLIEELERIGALKEE